MKTKIWNRNISSALLTFFIVLGLSALFLVGVSIVFGENIRKLFGMSADALAGNDNVPAEVRAAYSRGEYADRGYTAPAPTAPAPTVVPIVNPVQVTREERFSTFAIDVDTASYTHARAAIRDLHALPDPTSVRVEEWVNAFRYSPAPPKSGVVALYATGAPSPIHPGTTLLAVSLKAREVAPRDRQVSHLVFLVDTSGSMTPQNRLPLAKQSMKYLVRHLNPADTVAIATYAGEVRDVLAPTSATRLSTLDQAIDGLKTEGGTAMGSGLELAYHHAFETLKDGESSRVMVFTDGDANIGRNLTAEQMLQSVSDYVKKGVTLTTVGFGMDNYRDDLLEQLADHGNGQSLYIDSFAEAEKVFGEKLSGTLELVGREVKTQVEFDPKAVRTYRLVGYQNRQVANRDFKNDEVDGGELGAGHQVTAFYEIELNDDAQTFGTLRVHGLDTRHHNRPFDTELALTRKQVVTQFDDAAPDFQFGAAVATAAQVLRREPETRADQLEWVVRVASHQSLGVAERQEFVALIEQARKSIDSGLVAEWSDTRKKKQVNFANNNTW